MSAMLSSHRVDAGRAALARRLLLQVTGQTAVARHATARGDDFMLQDALEQIIVLAQTALLAVDSDRRAAVARFQDAVRETNRRELARAARLAGEIPCTPTPTEE